ncbi:hypothetical protein OE88DRAFT_1662535 [Heliocybe sulcata]|uniref:Uncharacterized protein n=1 Tax=Heliocybe sulcata TaxID=5364 RepID=A0A5C3N059_9AGAM|nr:hypothetical protein OE88DRAFT_1662535 [Heliocybe sulcata]
MGSHFSVVNDTDEVVWITHGVNTAVLQQSVEILRATAAAGASVPIPALGVIATGLSTFLEKIQSAAPDIPRRQLNLKDVEAILTGTGMRRLAPGETFTSDKLALSLIQQAEVAIVKSNNGEGLTVRTGHFTVWSGQTDNSNQTYKMSDHLNSLEGQEIAENLGVRSSGMSERPCSPSDATSCCCDATAD